MIGFRPLRWPDDRASLATLDTSFTTDRVYRLQRTDRSFNLEDVVVSPPVSKSYRLADDLDTLPTLDWAQIAEDSGVVVGLAAMRIGEWNRRANLEHLYLAPSSRGLGAGRAMVESALSEARRRKARCLWVETQTINYGAVRFYERVGFEWCGLDTRLYDERDVGGGEIALFFSRVIE